jgi:hypothetical protein
MRVASPLQSIVVFFSSAPKNMGRNMMGKASVFLGKGGASLADTPIASTGHRDCWRPTAGYLRRAYPY